MATRTYQLYSTANQANATSFTVLNRGRIVGVTWGLQLDSAGDNATIRAELSFNAMSTDATDGVQGQVVSFCWGPYLNVATAVGIIENQQMFIDGGLNITVEVGNKVYLNTVNAAGGYVKCLVKVEES